MAPSDQRLRLAGSLWSVPPSQRRARLESAVAGGLDLVHWDLADGSMGPAGGFDASEAAALTAGLPVRSEAHLMVADAAAEAARWWDHCERIVVHVESDGWREACDAIAARGVEPAVAISPDTPLSALPDDVRHVLVMSVRPGAASSGFLPSARTRAAEVASRAQRDSIGWDGSVDLPQVRSAREHGVTWLVSGGAMLGSDDSAATWPATARGSW